MNLTSGSPPTGSARNRVFRRPVLRKALPHIAFDIYHYECYATLWSQPQLRARSSAAQQAMIYALLLHLRLLLVFFYRPSKFDDCNLDRFSILPGFMHRFGKLRHRRQVEKTIENLNKRLAHITARRWRVRAPIMQYYTAIDPELRVLIARFESALPKNWREEYLVEKQRWANSHPPLVR